jgi:hypothetical protein
MNKRLNSASMRDYGDCFGEAYRILQDPFSFRLMEINTKCGNVFKKMNLEAEEKEQLFEKFDHFFRDKINVS